MTVKLESLRVDLQGDSSSYVAAVTAMTKANADQISSNQDLGRALAQTDTFIDRAGRSITGLSKTSIDGYGAASSHAAALKNLGNAMDRGTVSADRAQLIVEGLNKKYGLTANATMLASAGFGNLAAVVEKANAKFQIVPSQLDKVGQVFANDFSNRINVASGALGVFGTALNAVGPIGLGVAASVGGAILIFDQLAGGAHELAQKARELHEFSEAAGLSTAQIQLLRAEAGQFGLTADEVQSSVQQFTSRFNELRVGQGDLLTQVRRVNPALADQMAQATGTAQALTLFAGALDKTDNAFQRNAMMRAATGRGGLRQIELFQHLGSGQLNAAPAGGMSDDMIKNLSALEIQINSVTGKAKSNFESIFAEPVLSAELRFAQTMLTISTAAKEFSLSGDWAKLSALVDNPRVTTVAALLQAIPGLGTLTTAGMLAVSIPAGVQGINAKLRRAAEAGYGSGGAGDQGPSLAMAGQRPSVSSIFSGNANVAPNLSFLTGAPQIDPRYSAEQLRAQISAMGEAATYAQKLSLAQQELALKGKEAGLSEDQMAKALATLNAASASQQLNARISALGQLASTDEVLHVKQLSINLERAKGVQITETEAAAILRLTELQKEQALLQDRITAGVANENQIRSQLGMELQTWIDRKLIDPNNMQQMADATAVMTKRLAQMSEQAEVARAPLEGLKRQEIEGGNFRNQFDQFGTSFGSSTAGDFADFATHSKTASQAFTDFSQNIVRSSATIVANMTLVRGEAALMQQAFSFFSSLTGGGFSNDVYAAGQPGAIIPQVQGGIGHAHTGGIIGVSSLQTKSVNLDYFNGARRFHTGGVIGPDEVPIIARRGEGVFTPEQMQAMGGPSRPGPVNLGVKIVNQGQPLAVTSQQTNDNGDIEMIVRAITRDEMASGRTNAIQRKKYNQTPRLRRLV